MPGRGEDGQKVHIADACRSMATSLKDHEKSGARSACLDFTIKKRREL
jgi:hypothetical protein